MDSNGLFPGIPAISLLQVRGTSIGHTGPLSFEETGVLVPEEKEKTTSNQGPSSQPQSPKWSQESVTRTKGPSWSILLIFTTL